MDVIWNLTRICPWDCAICCVTALHACETTKFYLKKRQKDYGMELSLAEKMQVLKDFCDEGFDIDFSGGDPLYYSEDMQVVEQATVWLPASKISVSMTGVELTERKIELLRKVKNVEFTIDSLPEVQNFARPTGYNLSSIVALKECIAAGIRTRAVMVLYPLTMKESNLRSVYKMLCELEVPEWELLRFYPVGRAKRFSRLVSSKEDYLKTMALLRTFRGPTKIFFQHSLRMLEGDGVCPAVHKAFGILPDGNVSACAWAINVQAQPIDDCFRLGKMPEQKIGDILKAAQKRAEYRHDAHESRIITWLGKRSDNHMKIRTIQCRSVLTKSNLPKVDYCVNPYVGCLHACVYCYARFIRRFTGHGEPWGHFLDIKLNAPEVLARELAKKPRRGTVLLGSVTDAYQPSERKHRLTRAILEILLKHDFPVSILTKSDLVVRDMDLLKQFSDCEVGLTVTSTDESVARSFEPHAPSPKKRIEALGTLHQNGITTYAFIGPILPELTNLELIFEAIQGKVNFVMAESLNMKCGNRHFIETVLSAKYPGLLHAYMAGFNKGYWDEVEVATEKLAAKHQIPHKGFFHH